MRLFQVDAFTSRLFAGNPAGVVPLESWIDEGLMQSIASENNLSETAFVAPTPSGPGDFHIRWFTPRSEIDLCGHATLASAHVLFRHLSFAGARVAFTSASGLLAVAHEESRLVLDFPSRPAKPVEITGELVAALGGFRPMEAYKARDVMAVFESKKDVLALRPNMELVAALCPTGLIVTAPGAGHDFVSRFFAPAKGVPEDPVTGSAHCTLVPYWAQRLGKHTLRAHQVSSRGGELFCRLDGDRVHMGGSCVTYMEGRIFA